MISDYTDLTEVTGSKMTKEQLQRMYTRYRFASDYCRGKDVLEAACGVGQGLGILSRVAKSVIAGDYTKKLVDLAMSHYGNRLDIRQFDAQAMPFNNDSFDVVILYEAIYYLREPEKFLDECKRVLRPDGMVLICTANKDWSGFARSPHSYNYYSVPELVSLLGKKGFKRIGLFGDCPVSDGSVGGGVISLIRTMAVKFNLIPGSMKAKEKLKRLFFGKLIEMPAELKENMAEYERPAKISPDKPVVGYKVLFAVAQM